MKLRITFVKDEIGLQAVFLRLACLPDEGARARTIRAALSMLHETMSMPRWFLALPETSGPLPRSFTVRVALLGSDPSLTPVMDHLARIPEDERSGWIKNLMARSLGSGPSSLVLQAAAVPVEAKLQLPSLSAIPAVPFQSSDIDLSNTPATNDPAKTQLFKNALKSFDLDRL